MENVTKYVTHREILIPYEENYSRMAFEYDVLDLSGIDCPVILFHTKSNVCYTKFNNVKYFTLPKDVLELLIEESMI